MSYYPAKYHFGDLVLCALVGFLIGLVIFRTMDYDAVHSAGRSIGENTITVRIAPR